MGEVGRINSHLVNNLTNMDVLLYMDRRFELAVDAPADLAFLREVGPILKFHLCIQSYRQFMDLHGVWSSHTTTILNHRAEFPAAHAWLYLNELFSPVVTLFPPAFLSDTVSRIFSYVVESSANPRAAVIHLKAELTVVHPARRASVVDSVVIVDEPPLVHPNLAGDDWINLVVDSVMIVDIDEPEVTPVYLPRQPARRSARDLKERYLFSASEADDNLGDCAVCLEELKIITGKSSWGGVLKMPCSHKFHYRCISKWLKTSDSCPLCRAVIP